MRVRFKTFLDGENPEIETATRLFICANWMEREAYDFYGIVFTGYSLAAFFAPRVAVQMAAANNGNYSQAFYVAIALSLVGLVLSVLYSKISKKGVQK